MSDTPRTDPAARSTAEAVARCKTLARRLRYRGDEYNADIAEFEILPFLQSPTEPQQPASPG